jgi:hypothetical protein
MWVWIPRYSYQIATNHHTNSVGIINIKFLKGKTNIASDGDAVEITPKYSGSSQTNYIKHPAFTFGTTEVTGIWVGKFETSVSNQTDLCYTNASSANCNKTTLLPKIIPNVASWRSININNMFIVSRNMETNEVYGWGTSGNGIDTHMMKNTEWGAAAYLSQSTYGKNAEIWINNSSLYTTGCAGNSVSESSYSGCQYMYNTSGGMEASTTGNIYGIYDMSGGATEYTAAYINNGDSTLTTYGNSLVTTDSKYKDIYIGEPDTESNNYENASNKKGDAIYEISNSYSGSSAWHSDFTYFPSKGVPWFARGGSNTNTTSAGAFSFIYGFGCENGSTSFRIVILVGKDL